MSDGTCSVCGDEFTAAGPLSDHAWDVHDACRYCGEELTTEDELYVHWLARHDEDLSRVDRKRAESEVGELTFGNRLAHQGPIEAVQNTSLSRRQLLGGGAAVAFAGIGDVAGKMFLGSPSDSSEAQTGASAPTAATKNSAGMKVS